MDDVRYSGNLCYEITETGYVSVIRNENFTFAHKDGKTAFSFIFVSRGELQCTFFAQKETLHARQGDVLFIPPNYPYTTTYKKDNTKIQILNFNVKNNAVSSTLSSHTLFTSPEISLLFHSISLENMRNPLFLSAKIYEILYHMEQRAEHFPSKYAKLSPAVAEFSKYYFENKPIAYYSSLCKMSEPNFRKIFKEYTGQSPIEYRNLIRIQNVKRFLESGEFTVAEAAYLAGFNNMAFFYKLYRKYNCTEKKFTN